MSTAPNIFPALRYADATKALKWLEEAFGFRQTFAVPGPDGTIAHAEMRLGAGTIMFGSAPNLPAETTTDLRSARASIYAWVPEIDAHYARARAAGAEITMELADTDYGSREYAARDFEGNHWCFGTYLPQPD
jgi:uncharacterized glyoxalase superfamily protein PhnB